MFALHPFWAHIKHLHIEHLHITLNKTLLFMVIIFWGKILNLDHVFCFFITLRHAVNHVLKYIKLNFNVVTLLHIINNVVL